MFPCWSDRLLGQTGKLRFSERPEGRDERIRGETGGQVHRQLIYKGGRKLSTMTLQHTKKLFIKWLQVYAELAYD